MIHQLLEITRPLIGLDTETTGVDPQSSRIVELGFQIWTATGMEREWRSEINPEIPIPNAEFHGISTERVNACRLCRLPLLAHSEADHEFKPVPTFKQIAVSLAKGFVDCDYIGKNPRFDLRITEAEMKRAGVLWSYAGARIIDAGRLEQLAVPRTLSDLYKKYTGEEHSGAHGAIADVQASIAVVVRQLQTYSTLPRSIEELHALQWPGWLTNGGEFRMMNGVAVCQFGKHRGKSMRKIPVDYFDWLLRNDFPADVKALASEAKLGRFPDGTP